MDSPTANKLKSSGLIGMILQALICAIRCFFKTIGSKVHVTFLSFNLSDSVRI